MEFQLPLAETEMNSNKTLIFEIYKEGYLYYIVLKHILFVFCKTLLFRQCLGFVYYGINVK